MKKFFGKFLPVVALLFAVGAAIVTHGSTVPPVGTLKAKINGQWQVISETQEYVCVSSSSDCTARFNAQDQMIPNTLVPGTYTPQ